VSSGHVCCDRDVAVVALLLKLTQSLQFRGHPHPLRLW